MIDASRGSKESRVIMGKVFRQVLMRRFKALLTLLTAAIFVFLKNQQAAEHRQQFGVPYSTNSRNRDRFYNMIF